MGEDEWLSDLECDQGESDPQPVATAQQPNEQAAAAQQPDQPAVAAQQPDQAAPEQPASVSDEADMECDSMSEVVGGSGVNSDQECYQPDVTAHQPHQPEQLAQAQQAEMPLLPGSAQLPAAHSLPVPQLQTRLSQLPPCLSLPEAQTEQLQLHMAAAAATTSQLPAVAEAPCAYDLPDDLGWCQSPSHTLSLPDDLGLYESAQSQSGADDTQPEPQSSSLQQGTDVLQPAHSAELTDGSHGVLDEPPAEESSVPPCVSETETKTHSTVYESSSHTYDDRTDEESCSVSGRVSIAGTEPTEATSEEPSVAEYQQQHTGREDGSCDQPTAAHPACVSETGRVSTAGSESTTVEPSDEKLAPASADTQSASHMCETRESSLTSQVAEGSVLVRWVDASCHFDAPIVIEATRASKDLQSQATQQPHTAQQSHTDVSVRKEKKSKGFWASIKKFFSGCQCFGGVHLPRE